MSDRIPQIGPESMTEAQREVYDRIAGGPRASGPQLFELVDSAGRLNGPFNAMVVAPGVGDALQALGAAIRYATSLTPRIREMAILAVATRWDSEFERYAHEPIGEAAGLSPEEIVALRKSGELQPTDSAESAALQIVMALLDGGEVDDPHFDVAREVLGDTAMVELAVLVGYYQTLALAMRFFRIGAPESSRLDEASVDS